MNKIAPIFRLSIRLTVNMFIIKKLPMTGFEPQTSGIGNDHTANCATTTAAKNIEKMKVAELSFPAAKKWKMHTSFQFGKQGK